MFRYLMRLYGFREYLKLYTTNISRSDSFPEPRKKRKRDDIFEITLFNQGVDLKKFPIYVQSWEIMI